MGSVGLFSIALMVVGYFVADQVFVTPPLFFPTYVIVSTAVVLTALLGF